MKIIIFVIFIFFGVNTLYSQTASNIQYEKLKASIIDDLYEIQFIDASWREKLKDGSYTLHISGALNNTFDDKLKVGVYIFILKNYTFFLLINENNYQILDFRDKHGLDMSLLRLFEFCDNRHYCIDIISTYVTKLITIYSEQKDISKGMDINCRNGIRDSRILP